MKEFSTIRPPQVPRARNMEKLDKYYGDKRKVVRDCMAEITNFGKVPHNYFKQLIALKTCLEMNFARLTSCDLQGEMNNTSYMKLIQLKFPVAQQLEWTKYLEELPEEKATNPFVEFMGWLEKSRKV